MVRVSVSALSMSYAIDIPASLSALMEGFPLRTRAAIYGTLERIIQHAELWGPDDERWEQLAWRDGEGLRFYADGCCVRLEFLPGKRLVLLEIGRILVHLPPEGLAVCARRPGFSS